MAAVTDGDSLVGIFEAYGRVELGHRGASTSVEYCVPGPNVQLDESSDAVVPSETCATRANGAPVRTRETVVGLGLALADPQERWRAGVDLRVLPSVTDGNGAPVEFEIGAPILGNFARIRSGDKSYKGILALVPFARFATAEDEPSPFFGLRLEVRGDTTLLGRALSPIR